jgi:hypothetical protein
MSSSQFGILAVVTGHPRIEMFPIGMLGHSCGVGQGGLEHDPAETGRMHTAVRTWVLRAAGGSTRSLRAIPPRALLSLLCAAALSPVLAAGAGLGAIAVAGSGVLSSVGGSVLSGVIADALDRKRPKDGHPPSPDLDAQVAAEIERVLAAQDLNASALRAEIGTLLRKIDAGGAVLQAAMEQSDERLRNDVIAAMKALSSSFSEMRFLINDVAAAAAQIQKSLDQYGASIRGGYRAERPAVHRHPPSPGGLGGHREAVGC